MYVDPPPPPPAQCFKTGSSVGGIVYPIMLNHLFHGSAGFAWGVRAQAFLTLGLLIPANLLMRPPPRRAPSPDLPKARLIAMLTDVPYILTIIGQVICLTAR